MTTTTTEHELNQMGLRDLQSRFREVVGEETRCPNKTFLVRRILAALAAQQAGGDSGSATATEGTEAPSTSGAPSPEPEAIAPPESERRPSQPAVETAVASLPAAEPTSAEPLADSSAIEPGSAEFIATAPAAEPTSTEVIATASASEPASAEHLTTEPSAMQPFAEEPPGTEELALAEANVEPEEEAPATVVEPGPVTEAMPPRLALADDEAPLGKQPLDAPESEAFENSLANDALDDASASHVGEDAPASNTVDDDPAQPAPSTSVPAAAPASTQPTRGRRGRFRDLTVEQLQALYLSTVGRASGSTDRRYLEWKIREAEKGRIPVGPRESRAAEHEASDDLRVLPLRLDGAAVDALDATWKSHGMKSRMDFFRRALGHYLAHLGANGAAMHFASQSAE